MADTDPDPVDEGSFEGPAARQAWFLDQRARQTASKDLGADVEEPLPTPPAPDPHAPPPPMPSLPALMREYRQRLQAAADQPNP